MLVTSTVIVICILTSQTSSSKLETLANSAEVNSAVEDPSPNILPGLLFPRESEAREVTNYLHKYIKKQ